MAVRETLYSHVNMVGKKNYNKTSLNYWTHRKLIPRLHDVLWQGVT